MSASDQDRAICPQKEEAFIHCSASGSRRNFCLVPSLNQRQIGSPNEGSSIVHQHHLRSACIHHGNSSILRVGTREYPSEQGEYDLSRIGFIRKEGIRSMRVSHSSPAISAVFDDPNLVSCVGLAPTMALAQRAGLADLVARTLTLKAEGGVNAHLKVPALVAGMVAGPDSHR